MTNPNDPAFFSKREFFAAMAMLGLLLQKGAFKPGDAIQCADGLISELNKTGT